MPVASPAASIIWREALAHPAAELIDEGGVERDSMGLRALCFERKRTGRNKWRRVAV